MSELRLIDEEDNDSVEFIQTDQKLSIDCQQRCYGINEKPRPNFDSLLKKPTNEKRAKAKRGWPKVITDNANMMPSQQSSPKSPIFTSPENRSVAPHRKKLIPKRLNFDLSF